MMRRIISVAKNDAGLTVVELVFASVVLMGAIITMMSMFDTAIDVLRYTTSRSLATQLGNEVMEDFRSLPYEGAVLSEVSTWPVDADLDDGFDPPKFRDIDDSSSTVWRSLVTTDTEGIGLGIERFVTRHRINFTIHKYVMWADDAPISQAYKRLVVKVSWVGPYIPGEVVLTTNFSQEDEVDSRPSAKILGVRSTNFNYFSGSEQETTMGAGDSIRGGGGTLQPVTWTVAVVTGAKASYIDYVDYDLYAPNGTSVAQTRVTSQSVDHVGNRFRWDDLNTTTLDDDTGYLIRAEAVDDRGQTDVDSMPINIDNSVPANPVMTDVVSMPDSTRLVLIKWDWEPAAGDAVPELSRFIIQRREGAAGMPWTPWLIAPAASERSFVDSYVDDGVKYWYFITAIDTAGNQSLRVGKDKGEIIKPRWESVAPTLSTSATGQAVSWKSIELKLEQTTDTGGSGLAGYAWWSRDETSPWAIIGSSTDTVSDPLVYIDTGLKPGRTYRYTSAAFDFDANVSCCWPPSPYTGIMITTPMR